MIWLFRASAIALALLWTNWRDLDAIGEIFMPVLVGLADEHLCFMSCVFVEVFSNTTDVVWLGTRWEPVGDPLGTRWGPVSRTGFAAGRRLLAGYVPGRDLVNSPAVDESTRSASLK